MLQDFTFLDFDEIVTNMKYVYFGFNLARVCLAGVYIPYTLENFHVWDNGIKGSRYSTEHVSGSGFYKWESFRYNSYTISSSS